MGIRPLAVPAAVAVTIFAGRVTPVSAASQAVDTLLTQAIDWYTGVAGRVDDARARQLLLQAAEEGDPMSRMWLARVYSRGRMGFEQDTVRARLIAREVIADIQRLTRPPGVTEALFLMGTAFDEGLGLPADPRFAVVWYRRAAERGHVLAQHNLGNAFADGRAGAPNDSLAVVWWRRAAEQGDAVTQLRLGQSYEAGRGVAPNLEEAIRWYREASRRGNVEAGEALRRLGRP